MKKIKITNSKETFDISYTFDNSAWKKIMQKEEKKHLKNIKIDGFRPGSPAAIEQAKKLVSKENVMNDSLEPASKHAIMEIIDTKEFSEIHQSIANLPPQVEVLKISNEELELTFKFKKVPEVTVGDWRKIKITAKKEKVTEEEIKSEIDALLEKNAIMEPKANGKIAKNDTVTFDFKGFLNDVPFENGEAKNFELEIGSGQFIPGFEEKMINLKIDDEKIIDLIFPEEYHEKNLAGKPVKFEIKIHDIKTKKQPSLDDDFVKSLKMENVKDVKELNKHLKNSIADKNEKNFNRQIETEIVDGLISITELSYEDEKLYESEKNQIIERNKKQFEQYGIGFEQLLQMTGMTEEKFIEQASSEARKLFLYKQAMDKIIEIDKDELNQKEFESEIEKISKEWNKSVSEVLEVIGENVSLIKKDLLRLKKIKSIIKELTK